MLGVGYTIHVDGAPPPAALTAAIQRVEVETSVDEASAFRIRLGVVRNGAGDWTVLQDDVFRPLTRVTIKVRAGGDRDQTLINGFVLGEDATYSDEPGRSALDV